MTLYGRWWTIRTSRAVIAWFGSMFCCLGAVDRGDPQAALVGVQGRNPARAADTRDFTPSDGSCRQFIGP